MKTKQCTIVFIHKGYSWYLYYTIKQARAFNPKAHIVLISDIQSPELARYAEILPINKYTTKADGFERIYKHLSYNSREFELFCFQRWFILEEYIRLHDPERLVHLDSDILVFQELNKEFSRLASSDMALVGFQGPFSLFINRPPVISEFCQHIINLYTHEYSDLEKQYLMWKEKTQYTAVSDMHALHTFVSRYKIKTVDLSIQHDNAVYDNVFHESDGYVHKDGYKLLDWVNKVPHVKHVESGSMVALKTIHCQGPSKTQIMRLFNSKDSAYYVDRVRMKLRRIFKSKH